MQLFQIDAFAEKQFEGNPAAVCPLSFWPDDSLLQAIATENNLSETAFFVREGEGYRLRWFTPASEVDLCGHATLASAHVLYTHLGFNRPEIVFFTRSGELKVFKAGSTKYALDFPSDDAHLESNAEIIKTINKALGIQVADIFRGKDDFLLQLESEKQLERLRPDFRILSELPSRGLIVTTESSDPSVDFYSRCFYPQYGIDEDPVTGSAHTMLTPWWSMKLRKNRLIARQGLIRQGHLECIFRGARTTLIGSAVTFLKGKIQL